jgi:hypothetical protein
MRAAFWSSWLDISLFYKTAFRNRLFAFSPAKKSSLREEHTVSNRLGVAAYVVTRERNAMQCNELQPTRARIDQLK